MIPREITRDKANIILERAMKSGLKSRPYAITFRGKWYDLSDSNKQEIDEFIQGLLKK